MGLFWRKAEAYVFTITSNMGRQQTAAGSRPVYGLRENAIGAWIIDCCVIELHATSTGAETRQNAMTFSEMNAVSGDRSNVTYEKSVCHSSSVCPSIPLSVCSYAYASLSYTSRYPRDCASESAARRSATNNVIVGGRRMASTGRRDVTATRLDIAAGLTD